MRFLERERATAARLMPGLDESLKAVSSTELEAPDGPGLQVFCDSGGPGLLAPVEQQGKGASALDALRVQRALGSRAPSLALATAAHHFVMAVLAAGADRGGLDPMLAGGLAGGNRLAAFGFPEEGSGAGSLSPLAAGKLGSDGVQISGATRPLSRAGEPDVLAVSITIPYFDGRPGEQLALALVPAGSEGWSADGTGTTSGRITLDNVLVTPDLLVQDSDLHGQLDALLTEGFAWFQLLLTGSFLGAASALVERVLLDQKVPESERVALLVEAEGAMKAAEGTARRIDAGDPDESTLADALYMRYSVQDALSRLVPRAVDLLGGLDSAASAEVAYLAAGANGADQQPPARARMTGPLAAYLADGPLTIA